MKTTISASPFYRALPLCLVAAWCALGSVARADCPPLCRAMLCSASNRSIVTGQVEPDNTDAGRVVLVVDQVLHLAPGVAAPAAGTRLQAGAFLGVASGPVVAYLQAADSVVELFPIEAGAVQCRHGAQNTSAPTGKGVTPEALVAATMLPDRGCDQTLRTAGYPDLDCDDESGFGCTTAGGKPAPARWPVAMTALAALALLARPRRRG